MTTSGVCNERTPVCIAQEANCAAFIGDQADRAAIAQCGGEIFMC